MEELLLLSKEFISKENFLNEIKIDNHTLKLCGSDDQLWLINTTTNDAIIKIDLVFLDDSGNVIKDDVDSLIDEGLNLPYKGFIYNVEYRSSTIMKDLLNQLNNKSRDLYYEVNASGEFISL